MRLTKIGVKTIILRHWGNPGARPLSDAQVCARISIETGWQVPNKKQVQAFMERYVTDFVKIALLKPAEPVKSATASREFYRSDEWRALRYQALTLHGGRCQCCGRGASHGTVLHVDHIKPRSKYPELQLVLSNLQVLCEDCNLGKGARDETDWRPPAHEVI